MDGLVAFSIGDTPVYAYGLMAALAAVCFCVLLFCFMKKKDRKGYPLCALLALLCGAVTSRVLFCLLDQYFLNNGIWPEILRPDHGGFSMLGALLGMSLGIVLGCRLQGMKTGESLDASVPGLLLFTAVIRAGEWGSEELGLSRTLKTEWLMDSFMTQDGIYLKVYLLEILAALILFFVALTVLRRKYTGGGVMLGTMMLFGGVQVIMESLKHDGHMSFGFVGVQHILSYAMLVTALVILAVPALKNGNKRAALAALIPVIPVAGLCVWIEFLLDRTPVSRWLLYLGYTVLMAGMCAAGFRLLRAYRKDK